MQQLYKYFFIVLNFQLNVLAYSSACQEAMTMTAMSKLTGTPLAQLKRLLLNKDAVDVSHWADKVALKYPETVKYLVEDGPAVLDASGCPIPNIQAISQEKKPCLLTAMKHFYTRLYDDESQYKMIYPVDMEFTDADALRYVIGLMTHLHNPMSYQPDGDRSAAKIKGHVIMPTGEGKKMTLFEFYDKQFCEIWKTKYIHYWNSGWTHFQALGNEFYNSVVQEFGTTLSENLKAFDSWATQTAAMKCDLIKTIQDDFTIDGKTLDRMWVSGYRSHILKAGVRLAVVLQTILDKQNAPGLRRGSGVEIVDSKVKEVAINKGSTTKTVIVNVSIVAVVVAIGWYFLVRDNKTSAFSDVPKKGKNTD